MINLLSISLISSIDTTIEIESAIVPIEAKKEDIFETLENDFIILVKSFFLLIMKKLNFVLN
ncbi:hypothetical protein RRG40_04435 [Mycoplasmopsis felis]|uniref:hypothetical protein n=1 Tax=Mycoplasmopsis felis TaxID=33923 RepID=UPI002AFF149F|nr:hypothetical protein [Mycoplasmopsis felis]WQQ05369.1 hypothetical protein RRG59_03395 [Mycoplasmopsis felis]